MADGAFDDILEPRKKYFQELEKTHLENTTQYFENLVKESGVDAESNKRTCQKIYGLESQIRELKKKEMAGKGKMMLVIILFAIVLFAGLIMSVIGGISEPKKTFLIILGLVLVAADIGFLIFAIIRRSKNSKLITKLIKEKSEELEKLKNEAYGQMAALNNLYEWNIYNILMRQTTPLIEMDRVFSMEKYNQLVEHFNWNDSDDIHKSTILAQSGSILGNPFIIAREVIQSMINYTYTGSITIHWTERVSDGKGGSRTVSRSQTLTASVTQPKPDYTYRTRLIFGSEAAPDLSFTRDPEKHGYSESDLKKFFKSKERKIDEYAKKHPGFTPLGNDEFEDFFGGLDRDHEVQYRLLFTPLAQKSMLDILTHDTPYGDDFSFYKTKMINVIKSYHSQTAEYDGYPSVFYHFDLEAARKNFIEKNMNYFKGVYFDLAPLMAIPLYQQYPTNEYIFKRDVGPDYSRHLSEMEANRFDTSYFKPNESVTKLILKSEFIKQKNGTHAVNMHAYGFKGIEHVSYISRMGGDGRSHDVPVHWVEYIPVDKTTPFIVQETNLSRHEFFELNQTNEYSQFLSKNVNNNAILCSRGLFSFINKSAGYSSEELENTIQKILKK